MDKDAVDDKAKQQKRMSTETILKMCQKNNLYATPCLNDVLYLHYEGYSRIECLAEYTGLKCLWLNSNAIVEVSGLEHQTELRCLYLHNNFIRKIENLNYCRKLDTLNLSHNKIKFIENIDTGTLPALNTLNISNNLLHSIDGLEQLVNCRTLSVLDLSHNRIDDILIVKILSKMPELRVLTLVGNPVVNAIPIYRKTLIVECKKLTYLDSRPVLDKDRACAEAWKIGGFRAEQCERQKWIKKEQRKYLNSIQLLMRRQNKSNETGVDSLNSSDNDDDECTTCMERAKVNDHENVVATVQQTNLLAGNGDSESMFKFNENKSLKIVNRKFDETKTRPETVELEDEVLNTSQSDDFLSTTVDEVVQ